MTLADTMPTSQCRVVQAAAGNPQLQARLYSLGLYPGVIVDVLRVAPMGDPLQLRVGGTLLSVRKQEANLISVEAVG